MCHLNQFDLVELVHPDDASGFSTRCAGFPPKTGCVANKFFGKIVGTQDFFAMKICQLNLASRRNKSLVFLQSIHVRFKLRKLRRANHAIAPNQERWADFGVTMLPRVQIDQEIDKRAFQSRTRAGETNKTAAAQL